MLFNMIHKVKIYQKSSEQKKTTELKLQGRNHTGGSPGGLDDLMLPG
jgi:hypothetical protein